MRGIVVASWGGECVTEWGRGGVLAEGFRCPGGAGDLEGLPLSVGVASVLTGGWRGECVGSVLAEGGGWRGEWGGSGCSGGCGA